SSAWTGRLSERNFRGSTPSRSNRSISSWRPSTNPPTASNCCSSKALRRSFSRSAIVSRRPAGKRCRSSASTLRRRPTGSPRRPAAQGGRVLALAWLEDPKLQAGGLGPGDLPGTLVLLGLIGLLDPPRKEAIEAVKECHGGGIRVTMITGDHKITAAAIADMLGIGDGRMAITGAEIEAMNEAALQEAVRNVDVFARASPEHKLRLG